MTFILLSYYNKLVMMAQVGAEPLKIKSKRKREANEFWLNVATDINAGFTPEEVAERYTNPKTGKPYTREHIYWVIREINKQI